MKNQTIQNCAWVLIYGGSLSVVLALFVYRAQASSALVWPLALGGCLAFVVGVCFIYWRSRRAAEQG
jgi:hypothetical protein